MTSEAARLDDDAAVGAAGPPQTTSARRALALIGALAPARVFPAGADLLRQGECPTGAYFITAGLVKLHRGSADGRSVAIGLRAAGWPVGAAAVVLGQPHAATATTVLDTTALHVNALTLRGLLRSRPEVSEYLLGAASQEVQDATVLLADIACAPARERLERLLADLAAAAGRPDGDGQFRFQLPLRHWELAQLVNVTPQYLCELLAELEHEQVLRRHKGWLVLDPDEPCPRVETRHVSAGGRSA